MTFAPLSMLNSMEILNVKQIYPYFYHSGVIGMEVPGLLDRDICSLLQPSLDAYIEARDGLIQKDLIASDGTIFQVLELPCAPIQPKAPEMRADITRLICQSLEEAAGGR